MALIDTALTSVDSIGGSYAMVIGKNEMLVRNGEAAQRVELPQLEGMIITPDMVSYWFQVVGNWFVLMLAPFLILQAWIFQMIITLFFTLISMLINRSGKQKIPYGSLYRVTAVALTPMIFLQALSGLVNMPAVIVDFLIPVAGVAYIAFAMRAVNDLKD
jgi:hypothetical protein